MGKKNYIIISGKTNPDLIVKIGNILGSKVIIADTQNFPNGYPRAELKKEDRNINFARKKVIIITSLQYRGIGSPIEELELLVDLCANAQEKHLILTYLCGKNDIVHHPGSVTTLAWITNRIKQLHFKSITWFDPHHSSHIELFYPAQRTRFYFLKDVLDEISKKIRIDQIAATDFGSGKRAYTIRKILQNNGLKIAGQNTILFAEKDHDHDGNNKKEINHTKTIGFLQGINLLLADDMGLSMNTMIKAAKNIHQKTEGKKIKIHGAVAQFDPSSEAFLNLKRALNDEILASFWTSNSNPISETFLKLKNFHVVDISLKLAKLVNAISKGKLTNKMFTDI